MRDFTDLDATLEYEIAFALRNDMPVKSIAGRVRRICVEWVGSRPRGGDAPPIVTDEMIDEMVNFLDRRRGYSDDFPMIYSDDEMRRIRNMYRPALEAALKKGTADV